MKDQVVLITGGSGAIGSAVARLFSRAGARVVLAARNKNKAEIIAGEINNSGGNAYVIELDVTDPVSIKAMSEAVIEEFGRIDILVNAFGTGMIKSLPESDELAIKKVLDVNLYGTILVTKTVLPYMVEKKKGTVIMIPGIIGKYVMRHSSIYSASKFGVTGFAKALIEEYRRSNIKITLLHLGGVDTDFWENPEIEMRVQREKMLSSDEAAKAIYYAASQPENSVLNEMTIQPESHQFV